MVPAAGPGRDRADAAGALPAQRPGLVRLQPDAGRRPDGAVAPRRRPGRPAAAGRNCAASRIRLADRPLLPQQGGGRARGALVRVPGAATTRTTRRRCWPPRRPRPATGSPGCGPTATATSPRPTSTCGSSPTRSSPRPWSSSPGAARRSIYNGGLQQARVRYYDADRRRPGLPPAVAALVSSIDPAATVSTWSTWTRSEDRTVIVQAGAFAEHAIEAVRYTACQDRPGLGGPTSTGTASWRSPSGRLTSAARGWTCACRPGTAGDADVAAAPAGPEAALRKALRESSMETSHVRERTQRGKDEHGTADGPAGAGHRRGLRPGCRDRRGVHRRGRGGGGAGHGGGAACGTAGRDRLRAGRHHRRRRRAGRGAAGRRAVGRPGRAGQQRRHRRPGQRGAQHRRRVAAGAGRERDRDRPGVPRGLAVSAGIRARRGGQHGLDRGHRRAAGPGRVLGQQGRGGRADPGHGRRRNARRHPGQRGESWHSRHPLGRPAAGRGARPGRRAGRAGGPAAARPPGAAEEVAAAVVYLASPAAGSTTGTELAVDGGMGGLRLRPRG